MSSQGESQQTFIYDQNGNLTSDSNFAYTYDPENRLLSSKTGSTKTTYSNDPNGRRAIKTTGSTITNYLDDGDDEIAEYDGSGNLLRRFVPGPAIDEPIAYINGSGAYEYFLTDHHGTVIGMSDSNGALTEGAYTYDSYGNSSCSGSGTVPFRYTGQYLDPETCLYYYRARYYSPPIGRFLQVDPVGYTADLDLYTYVGNDPTNKTDPTGKYDDDLNQIVQAILSTFTVGHSGGTPVFGPSKAVQNGIMQAAEHPVSTAAKAAVPANGVTVTAGVTAQASTPVGGVSASGGVAVSVAGTQGGQNDVGVFGSVGGALGAESNGRGSFDGAGAGLTADVGVQSGSVSDMRGPSSQFSASAPVTGSVPGPTVGATISTNQGGHITGASVNVGVGTGSVSATSQHTATCSIQDGCGTK